MTFKFSKRSLNRMSKVHPALVQVMEVAIKDSPYDFGITSGYRTESEQAELVARGSSKTMNSKHRKGLAVDIAVYNEGQLTWEFKYYEAVSVHIKKVAADLGIGVKWGGDFKVWKNGELVPYRDGPHYQLV